MDLVELLKTLRRFWLLALVVFAGWIAIGVAAAFLPTERYRGTATLIAEPANQQTDFNSVDAVRFLLPAVVAQVQTAPFERAVRARLQPPFDEAPLSFDAELEPGTGILRVSAESVEANAVAAAANTAAAQLIARRVSRAIRVTMLEPATGYSSVSASLRIPILLGAAILGLACAVFSTLIARALRRRVSGAEEFRRDYGLEVIGEIPRDRKLPSMAPDVFNGPAHWRTAEAFQRLATNIEVAMVTRDFHAVAVTSCANGEGKSTVSSNLAWALASLGHRVVALDADYRRPSLHGRFPLDFAARDAGVDAPPGTRMTSLRSLRVVPALLQSDRHPAQIVSSEFPALLSSFKKDLVIVDTPPLFGAAEAMLIAMTAKTVLLVVDPKERPPAELERALHELRRANVDVLGIVLNRTRTSAGQRSIESYYVPLRTVKASQRQSAAGGRKRRATPRAGS